MSGEVLDIVKAVTVPVKSLVVDRAIEYLRYIGSYEANMDDLLKELKVLCSKKQDIDAEVLEGKERLRVMKRETMNWLQSLNELIELEEMKNLMKEERVAEILVKMMEHRVMKKLFKEHREIFDIVVHVVKNKCNNKEGGNEDALDAQEDADFKKVAKIAREVMKDTVEEFKEFMKNDAAAAAAAVKLLNNNDLEKLVNNDAEMAKILSKAENIGRRQLEDTVHDESESLLMKHSEDVQPVDRNVIKEKVGIWRNRMGSLMAFLDDENVKKGLPDSAHFGLEVIDALSKSSGSEQIDGNAKRHRYCGWCIVRLEGYHHRHDMSQRAEIMAKAIKLMIAGCPTGALTRPKRAEELENVSSDFMAGLESREELLKKILTALKDDKVNVVGVYGMGGSGKTTLAKEMANKRCSGLFDIRIIVEVSEAPNIKGIQDQIAVGINLQLDDVHSVAQRAHRLYNGLKLEKKRKILIILDNIWMKLKLDEVGIPRDSTEDFCCKLLITTRERQVCKIMDAQDANIYEVGMLNQREAIDLFKNQTGKKVDSGEYKPVADRLLRKCEGLPLAIVATAGVLRGKELSMWYQFAAESEKPISSQVVSEYRETYSILETSYKLMEVEQKKMFFFLACLSPLDSAVSVDDLMRYGIGLDLFQHVNNLSQAMDQASGWANELVSSSLLLNGDTDGQVKIHDVVRASAISFAEKVKDRICLVESIPKWICKETFEKFTAISLLSGHDFYRLSGVKAPLLEILFLKGDVSSKPLNNNFFRGMKNLKVLSLSNIDFKTGLPKSMGQLKRLKTLHLHQCKLEDIKLLGNLVKLLVLSLRGSSLKELPDEIGELSNLRLLDMEGCKGKINIPPNVLSRLHCLEGLYMSNSFNDWVFMKLEADKKASVDELNNLSELNVLEMEVKFPEQLLTLVAEHLDKFKIQVGFTDTWDEDMSEVQGFRRVLGLAYPIKYKSLRALLTKADCLQVLGCNVVSENLVPQWDEEGFNDLKYLEASYFYDVEYLYSSNKDNELKAFTNLEILKLNTFPKLQMICDGKAPVGIFSNLRCLTFDSLPELKYGLPLTTLALLNLVEVSIERCKSLKLAFIENVLVPSEEAVLTKEINVIMFPMLKSLGLKGVESLLGVLGRAELVDHGAQPGQPFFNPKSTFPSLECLKLSENKVIMTLWSKPFHVSSFQNLKVISICDCTELLSLGSPSVFDALVQLEELSISHCEKLQEVITKETEGHELREHVIAFPLLKRLSMERLPKLERFYSGSYTLDFPHLKSLSLKFSASVTNFDGSENSTDLFSDKIKFPCLEELEVLKVSDKVTRLWSWSSSDDQGESGSDSVISVSLKPTSTLRKLRLGTTNGLTSIPPLVSHNLSHLLITYFGDIKTLFSTSTMNREGLWTCSQLPGLENLTVSRCYSLENLFEDETDTAAKRLSGQLTGLELTDLGKVKIIPMHLFKNLRSLTVSLLHWNYLFPADLFIRGREQLQLLEALEIKVCVRMEVVIMDDLVGDGEDRVYVFPRLKSLRLAHLRIASFASKPSTALHFPSLETFEIEACSEIQTFFSGPLVAPKLKQVEIDNCNGMKCFLASEMNKVIKLPSLEIVKVHYCRVISSFSSEPLTTPKLRNISVTDCPNIKWFSPGGPNDDDMELPSLVCASINRCPIMQSFSPGGIEAPKLSDLHINGDDYSKLANEELQNLLGNLHTCDS